LATVFPQPIGMAASFNPGMGDEGVNAGPGGARPGTAAAGTEPAGHSAKAAAGTRTGTARPSTGARPTKAAAGAWATR